MMMARNATWAMWRAKSRPSPLCRQNV